MTRNRADDSVEGSSTGTRVAPTLIVIGAGPGIGRSVAQRFAKDGYAVGIIARSRQTLEATLTGLGDAPPRRRGGRSRRAVCADATHESELRGPLPPVSRQVWPPGRCCDHGAGLALDDHAVDLEARVPGDDLPPLLHAGVEVAQRPLAGARPGHSHHEDLLALRLEHDPLAGPPGLDHERCPSSNMRRRGQWLAGVVNPSQAPTLRGSRAAECIVHGLEKREIKRAVREPERFGGPVRR